MELHLGLALSSSSSSASSCSSEFDLINCNTNYDHESKIPIHHLKKRKHDDDGGNLHPLQTLPLLVWNNFCNKNQLNEQLHDHDEDNGDDGEVQSNSIFVHHRDDAGVIGWPPVKSCRKKLCHPKTSNYGGGGGGGGAGGGGGSKSMYVKVHMEGMGIARKIDLNLHRSYQTLVRTLANMFGKCYEDVKLTYQDKEGDWLLAGDVPWGSFIETIQRLKLLRKQ
ncbi:hypothetical protein L2E82_11966 [Cichorium intybus]|uniref:Uncharacterized protein n=1 Tax=Cichorium intybus TaxID=13427 RepID=A0ACB9GFV5_CICIN|nr:hypothetical protein L2E82_11966 [Cichorium intybus]